MKKRLSGVSGAVIAATLALTVFSPAPAQAAGGTVSVTFGDWRCTASGGGSVVRVQMGSEYGSVPVTSGRTITIGARLGANHLTGVVWCKRPWYKGGVVTPVYNVDQGLWVTSYGQSFNA